MLYPLDDYENVYYTFDFEHLQDITFEFDKNDKYVTYCENIMAADTETSNGRAFGNVAIGYDSYKIIHSKLYKAIMNGKTKVIPDDMLAKISKSIQKKIRESEPASVPYMWQHGIDDKGERMIFFLGREVEDYKEFLEKMSVEIRRQMHVGKKKILYAKDDNRICQINVYFHNFGFDQQVLNNAYAEDFSKCRHYKDEKNNRTRAMGSMFAREKRKPMKAKFTVNKMRVEIRDSCVMTGGKSLAEWGEDEDLYVKKIKKGQDFYTKIRTPITPLTYEEIEYGCIDIATMIYGLRKYKEKYKHLRDFPLTLTSIPRKLLQKTLAILDPAWQEKQAEVQLSYSYEDYKILSQYVYDAGYTHANAMMVNKVLKASPDNIIYAYDEKSAYPAQMCVCDHFPIGAFHRVDENTFNDIKDNPLENSKFCWYGRFIIENVYPACANSFFSLSKCVDISDVVRVDNGRIRSCQRMECYLTDYDYDIFRRAYDESRYTIKCVELNVAEAGRLPKAFIEQLLKFYSNKCLMKKASPSLYRESKVVCNGCYGVMVTRLLAPFIEMKEDGSWKAHDSEDELRAQYESVLIDTKPEKMIGNYCIGIYICKAAKHALWSLILQVNDRFCYADTDSCKGYMNEEDLAYVENYNRRMKEREDKAAEELGIDPSMYAPSGESSRLGIWDLECKIDIEFASLGAKRYFYKWNDTKKDKSGNIIHFVNHETTIAGLSKAVGRKCIKTAEDFIKQPFFDEETSGKKIATYIDNQRPLIWRDYLGNKYESNYKFGCCIMPTSFDLSIKGVFEEFLDSIFEDEYYVTFKDTPTHLLLLD